MKKVLSIFSVALLLFAAAGCADDSKMVIDSTKATAPTIVSYEVGDKSISAVYTDAVFNSGFNQKIAPNYSFVIVSVNGNAASRSLSTSSRDGVLTLSTSTLANALRAMGFSSGTSVSVELAIRASLQTSTSDNGINGHVDSNDHITISGFEIPDSSVGGNPYEDYIYAVQGSDYEQWTVIGSLANYGMSWDGDLSTWTDGAGNYVAPHVSLSTSDEFKFRKDAAWTTNLGGPFGSLDSEFSITQDGDNIIPGLSGVYDIFFSTSGTCTISEAYDPYSGYDQTSTWSVIGALGAYGYSWDTDIAMITDGTTSVAASVSLTASDEFKFRQDASWTVNLGGTFASVDSEFAVEQDGANIAPGLDGVYDLLVNPSSGTATVATATGLKISSLIGSDTPDDPVVTTQGWSLIGDFNEWGGDLMATEEPAGVWTAYVTLTAEQGFKWRKDGAWDENYGGSFVALGEPFEAVSGGDNIFVGDGFYKVVLDTNAGTITISDGTVWSLIGSFNSWNGDVDMTESSEGVWVSPSTTLAAGDEFKIRLNHDWTTSYGAADAGAVSVGTPFAATTDGGANVPITIAGDYIVTLDTNAGTILIETALPSNLWSVIGGIDGTGWSKDYYMKQLSSGIWVSDPINVDGEIKIRYNNDWGVNRGGTLASLGEPFAVEADGANINAGTGLLQVVYNPYLETITVNPCSEGWSVIGTFEDSSWDYDLYLSPKANGIYESEAFRVDGEIKIRYAGGWDVNRGGTLAALGEAFAVENGGANIAVPVTGQYYRLVYDSANETITVKKAWAVIGQVEGSSWNKDFVMSETSSGVWETAVTVDGEFKIRESGDWDVNRGGTLAALGEAFAVENGGANIAVPTTGVKYHVLYNSADETITVSEF